MKSETDRLISILDIRVNLTFEQPCINENVCHAVNVHKSII